MTNPYLARYMSAASQSHQNSSTPTSSSTSSPSLGRNNSTNPQPRPLARRSSTLITDNITSSTNIHSQSPDTRSKTGQGQEIISPSNVVAAKDSASASSRLNDTSSHPTTTISLKPSPQEPVSVVHQNLTLSRVAQFNNIIKSANENSNQQPALTSSRSVKRSNTPSHISTQRLSFLGGANATTFSSTSRNGSSGSSGNNAPSTIMGNKTNKATALSPLLTLSNDPASNFYTPPTLLATTAAAQNKEAAAVTASTATLNPTRPPQKTLLQSNNLGDKDQQESKAQSSNQLPTPELAHSATPFVSSTSSTETTTETTTMTTTTASVTAPTTTTTPNDPTSKRFQILSPVEKENAQLPSTKTTTIGTDSVIKSKSLEANIVVDSLAVSAVPEASRQDVSSKLTAREDASIVVAGVVPSDLQQQQHGCDLLEKAIDSKDEVLQTAESKSMEYAESCLPAEAVGGQPGVSQRAGTGSCSSAATESPQLAVLSTATVTLTGTGTEVNLEMNALAAPLPVPQSAPASASTSASASVPDSAAVPASASTSVSVAVSAPRPATTDKKGESPKKQSNTPMDPRHVASTPSSTLPAPKNPSSSSSVSSSDSSSTTAVNSILAKVSGSQTTSFDKSDDSDITTASTAIMGPLDIVMPEDALPKLTHHEHFSHYTLPHNHSQIHQVIRKKSSLAAKIRNVFVTKVPPKGPVDSEGAQPQPQPQPQPQQQQQQQHQQQQQQQHSSPSSSSTSSPYSLEDVILADSRDQDLGALGLTEKGILAVGSGEFVEQEHRGSVSSTSSADTVSSPSEFKGLDLSLHSTPLTSPDISPLSSPCLRACSSLPAEHPLSLATPPVDLSEITEEKAVEATEQTKPMVEHAAASYIPPPPPPHPLATSSLADALPPLPNLASPVRTPEPALPSDGPCHDFEPLPSRTAKKRLSFASITSFFHPRHDAYRLEQLSIQKRQHRSSSVPNVENPLTKVNRQGASFQRRHSLNDMHPTSSPAHHDAAKNLSLIAPPWDQDLASAQAAFAAGEAMEEHTAPSARPSVLGGSSRKLYNGVFGKRGKKMKSVVATSASLPTTGTGVPPTSTGLHSGPMEKPLRPSLVHRHHRSPSFKRSPSIRSHHRSLSQYQHQQHHPLEMFGHHNSRMLSEHQNHGRLSLDRSAAVAAGMVGRQTRRPMERNPTDSSSSFNSTSEEYDMCATPLASLEAKGASTSHTHSQQQQQQQQRQQVQQQQQQQLQQLQSPPPPRVQPTLTKELSLSGHPLSTLSFTSSYSSMSSTSTPSSESSVDEPTSMTVQQQQQQQHQQQQHQQQQQQQQQLEQSTRASRLSIYGDPARRTSVDKSLASPNASTVPSSTSGCSTAYSNGSTSSNASSTTTPSSPEEMLPSSPFAPPKMAPFTPPCPQPQLPYHPFQRHSFHALHQHQHPHHHGLPDHPFSPYNAHPYAMTSPPPPPQLPQPPQQQPHQQKSHGSMSYPHPPTGPYPYHFSHSAQGPPPPPAPYFHQQHPMPLTMSDYHAFHPLPHRMAPSPPPMPPSVGPRQHHLHSLHFHHHQSQHQAYHPPPPPPSSPHHYQGMGYHPSRAMAAPPPNIHHHPQHPMQQKYQPFQQFPHPAISNGNGNGNGAPSSILNGTTVRSSDMDSRPI
ncbi:hypothetical protein BGZ94_008719 [Podila epigama]|nr:hypothetical protein BGZ94_008719 [Podila epigama]